MFFANKQTNKQMKKHVRDSGSS